MVLKLKIITEIEQKHNLKINTCTLYLFILMQESSVNLPPLGASRELISCANWLKFKNYKAIILAVNTAIYMVKVVLAG